MRMNIRTSLYFWLENYRKIVDDHRKAVDKIVDRLVIYLREQVIYVLELPFIFIKTAS